MKPNLHRIKWGVRAVLAVTFAVSVAANILHAQPNAISRAFSGWAPLCLLAAIELVAKVPMTRRASSAARVAAMVAIAFIAAWVSYWQQVSVLRRYGETGHGSQYMLPLTVDGLIVIGSVSLVEIAGRIRAARTDLPEPPAAQISGLLSRGDPEGLCTAQPAPTFAPEFVAQPPTQVGAGAARSNEDAESVGTAQPVPVFAPLRVQPPRPRAKRTAKQRSAKRGPTARRHALRDEVEARILAGETDLRALHASLNGEAPSLRSIQEWRTKLFAAQPAKAPDGED